MGYDDELTCLHRTKIDHLVRPRADGWAECLPIGDDSVHPRPAEHGSWYFVDALSFERL